MNRVTKIDFTEEPDDVIEAAIAIQILKWKWMAGRIRPKDFTYYKNWLTPTGAEKARTPQFLKDYNQTIRLLGKLEWSSEKTTTLGGAPCDPFYVVKIKDHPLPGDTAFGCHTNFLKAACLALLHDPVRLMPTS